MATQALVKRVDYWLLFSLDAATQAIVTNHFDSRTDAKRKSLCSSDNRVSTLRGGYGINVTPFGITTNVIQIHAEYLTTLENSMLDNILESIDLFRELYSKLEA